MDFANGLYARAGEARGELTFELTRLMRSDMEPFRCGTVYGVDDRGRAVGRGVGPTLGVVGGIVVARDSIRREFSCGFG